MEKQDEIRYLNFVCNTFLLWRVTSTTISVFEATSRSNFLDFKIVNTSQIPSWVYQ